MTLKDLLDVLPSDQWFAVETPRGFNGAYRIQSSSCKDLIEKLLERTKNEKVVKVHTSGKRIYIKVE